MSEQQLIEGSRPVKRLLPQQPEVNIGSAGHVDHGKCLAMDEYVFFDGELATGREILSRLKAVQIVGHIDGGTFYSVDDAEVVSVSRDLRVEVAKPSFFIQNYSGTILKIKTKSGRTIRVTPEHPLLVNRDGGIAWCRAQDIRLGEHVSFVSQVPDSSSPIAFGEPLTVLREKYKILDFHDYVRLADQTQDFTRLSSLSGQDLDDIRMLARLSRTRLSALVHMDYGDLSAELKQSRITDGHRRKLVGVLEQLPLTKLGVDEVLLEGKKGGVSRIRLANLDLDLMKWFAFVWAEGTSTEHRIAVAQKEQLAMLNEFLKITSREFGLEFKKASDIDYHLDKTALVDYLTCKFGFKPGNKLESQISPWVLKTPSAYRSIFLRWFFTLDGEMNGRTGQISITQASEKNIVTFAYMLLMFGITSRFGTTKRTTKKGPKIYLRLTISGRKNLSRFAEEVGFEDPNKQQKLLAYIEKAKSGKETDFVVPVDPAVLGDLLSRVGIIRAPRPARNAIPAKRLTWYKAYSAARKTRTISRSKLEDIIDAVDARTLELRESMRHLSPEGRSLVRHLNLAKINYHQVGGEIGLTPKVVRRILRHGSRTEMESVAKQARKLTLDKLRESKAVVDQLRVLVCSQLEFDKVTSVEASRYDGLIYDLNVPGNHNFIAGNGAMVCHNTTTIQAITGIWASAHSEELRRGITIKVGYADAAFYKCAHTPAPAAFSTSPQCPVCGRETSLLRAVSFVDSPGHESLMTNMLAGAFLMDGALLVIAANEPVPKPQTREHLQALQLLGMKKIVIAQNKIDLVTDEEAKKNYEDIEKFVANTVAENAPIVPISAQQRLNIDALIESLEEVVPTPKRNPSADPLMYVVRSFDVNKPGTEIDALSGGVLGGSLTRGDLKVGEEVEVRPGMVDERSGKYSPLITKISSLQTGAGAADTVRPGGLVAVGTLLDPTYTKGDQMVGSVIGRPGTLPPTWEHLTLEVSLFDTAVGSAELVKVDKLRPGENLRLNLGTASTPAVVTSARSDVIEVDLKKPVAVEAGMRAAVNRRIAERWRLIGSGLLK